MSDYQLRRSLLSYVTIGGLCAQRLGLEMLILTSGFLAPTHWPIAQPDFFTNGSVLSAQGQASHRFVSCSCPADMIFQERNNLG